MGKSATRNVYININERTVTGSISDIKKEFNKLKKVVDNADDSFENYKENMAKLQIMKSRIREHTREINGVSNAWKKSSSGVGKFIGVIAASASVGALIQANKYMFDMGANLESIDNKARIVFGESLPEITSAAKENALAMGLTNDQYIAAAANMTDLLVPMGYSRDMASDISIELTNLSGALATWSNGKYNAAEVSEILSKALLGEREQLKSLGISITENDVKNRLAAKGAEKYTGKMLEQAKAAATLELITEKSVDAQTSFIENNDMLANKSAKLQVQIQNIAGSMAKRLIPVWHNLADVASNALEVFNDWLSIKLSEQLEDEQMALNQLVISITQAKDSQAIRNKLIAELQKKYPNFLGNLDAEKVSNEQLGKRLKEVNDQYIYKIALQKQDEKIDKKKNRAAKLMMKAGEAEIWNKKRLIALNDEHRLGIDLTNKSFKEMQQVMSKAIREAIKNGEINESYDQIFPYASNIDNYTMMANKAKDAVKELKKERDELERILKEQLGIKEVMDDIGSGNDDEDGGGGNKKEKIKIPLPTVDMGDAAELAQEQEKFLEDTKARFTKYLEMMRLDKMDAHEREKHDLIQKYEEGIQLAITGYGEESAQVISLRKERDKALTELEEKYHQNSLDMLNDYFSKKFGLSEEKWQELYEAQMQAQIDIDAAITEDFDGTIEQLDTFYDTLLEKAQKYGIDTVAITRDYNKEKYEIEQENSEKIVALRINQFQQLGNALTGALTLFAETEEEAYEISKISALADIAFNTAKAIAIMTSKAAATSATPVDYGIQVASAILTVITSIAQAKKAFESAPQRFMGGYYNVKGETDGRQYNARYIGRPGTGMLPSTPSLVLASEHGPEYFVANKEMEKPPVLAHVQAIEAIRQGASVPQYADGGATRDIEVPEQPSFDPAYQEIFVRLEELLTEIRNEGINAVMSDDLIVRMFDRYRQIKSARDL